MHKVFSIIIQVMSVKALGTSLKLTFEGMNQLVYPETWFFMLVVVTCVVTQMNYLNKVSNAWTQNILSRFCLNAKNLPTFLFLIGTRHLQYCNCVSNILCHVHNAYYTCKCDYVQGNLYHLTALKIYPSFLVVWIFLFQFANSIYENVNKKIKGLVFQERCFGKLLLSFSIISGLGWAKHRKHNFGNMWFYSGFVWHNTFACN